MKKFIPCLLGVGIVELNLYLDGVVSSFLPYGDYSLLYYVGRIVHFPIGVFGVSLSTVLLPQFSRIVVHTPKRLNFYLLEVAKLVTWIMIPVGLFTSFTVENGFAYILKDPILAKRASFLVMIYMLGMVFFCFSKVATNVFYALNDTWSPSVISFYSAASNTILNIVGICFLGANGIALSTVVAGMIFVLVSFFYFYKKHGVSFHISRYLIFFSKFVFHLFFGICLFVLIYFLFYPYKAVSKD